MKRHARAALFSVIVLVLAALPARAQIINVNQDTFVLSNEGPGFLITKLISAGHGADSPFQVTQFLLGLSQAGASISPFFVPALQICPASSPIFTTTLAQYSAAGAIAISTDGSVQVVNINSSPYVAGFTTIATGTAAVQNVRIVYNPLAKLTAWTVSGPLVGMTTTYHVFALAWALADSPAATAVAAPALSPWGMLLLAGLLVLAGVAVLELRRRSQRASASQR